MENHHTLVDGELTLRTPVDSDAPAVAAAVQASLAELKPWMPWATEKYDEASALQWIRCELGPAYAFGMFVDDQFVGSCGLNDLDERNRVANLGYWVHRDATGRGLATRATKLLHAFGHAQNWHRLEVKMSVDNHASRRVAEKAGAHYEGIAKGRLYLPGGHHDVHMFSFTPTSVGQGKQAE